jgi:N-dimethylarginine dimethylaminohydrolase
VTTYAPPKPGPVDRVATRRRYLMCPPEHFEVQYAINPWMDLMVPVDPAQAMRQWDTLRQTYLDLGHRVDVVTPEAGLPDMVFSANGALVLAGKALGARLKHPERQRESPVYLTWLQQAAARGELTEVREPAHINECEGDFVVVGELVLAGHGFRTDPSAHLEVQEFFGVPVVSLELVDPRYYHLDTALAPLDQTNIAYYPPAFSPGSRAVLRRLFPDAVLASEHDAEVLGLNAVSDGVNIVLSAPAEHLAQQLRERGYRPVAVDLSELLKAGGGAKCCSLEIRQCRGGNTPAAPGARTVP